MEIHLKITGILLVVLALVHFIFPRYFNWKQELAPLTLVNKQLMYVHTFFVAFGVLLMGIFCLIAAEEIVKTSLGRLVALGMFIFWAARLIFQFFVYSPKLWQGKRFETGVHVAFSLLWFYISAVFFLTYWIPAK